MTSLSFLPDRSIALPSISRMMMAVWPDWLIRRACRALLTARERICSSCPLIPLPAFTVGPSVTAAAGGVITRVLSI